MIVSLIVAHGLNGQIGLDNKLLWHIPEDFKKFKELTSGHTIIMGRNTFESLPGVLPNRHHIVITSGEIDINEGDDVSTVSSVENALENCKDQEKVWIIGGAQIYNYCIKNDLVDELCLSEVDYNGDADTWLDKIDLDKFNLVDEVRYESYKNDKVGFIPKWTFRQYKKR